jgi:hypothetical protein
MIELGEHRGFIRFLDWARRQRERWQAQLETCKPEQLGELQGAIRTLKLIEGGRELIIAVMRKDLEERGIPEEK